jgi:excinuclease ABC subunit B
MNKLNLDVANTLEFQGEAAVDHTFLNAMRDGAGESKGLGPAKSKTKPGTKGSRTKPKRAGRPGVPKTFGSRSK